MMFFLLFLWFLISISFITMLIITIVKGARKRKVKGALISTIILFVVGLACFIGAIASTPENDDYTVEESNGAEKNSDSTNDSDKKELELGDKIRVGGVDVKVANAEFVQPDSEYSTPDKERVLKITYEFKNNGDDQVLIDNTDFNITVDNTTQDRFYGMKDDDGFTKQLNQGNTYTGYEHYDVPDADEYRVEMDFIPSYKSYKADWIIKNSDIQ